MNKERWGVFLLKEKLKLINQKLKECNRVTILMKGPYSKIGIKEVGLIIERENLLHKPRGITQHKFSS